MADHVGIYAISGAFLPNPGSPVRLTATVPASILVTRSFVEGHVPGGVTIHIPASDTLFNLDNESVTLNAYLSGYEIIETVSSSYGTSSIDVPVFYSKSTKLIHSVYKHVGSLYDVFKNPPQSAPSGSAGYMFHIGTVDQQITSGSSVSVALSIGNGVQVAAAINGDTDKKGNLIKIVKGQHTIHVAADAADNTTNSVTVYPKYVTTLPDSFSWVYADVYLCSWVPLSSSVSGVFVNSSIYEPTYIDVPVTSSGKIRDVRVWTELIHDVRDVRQKTWWDTHGYGNGLQSIQVALRSPNTNFLAAHPVWNAPGADILPIRAESNLTGTDNKFGSFYYTIPDLLRNSYLLWAGHMADAGASGTLGAARFTSSYHEFDSDIDIRTVFWDGAPVNNPRDISSLSQYNQPYEWLTSSLGSQYYQSPTSNALKNNAAISDFVVSPWPSGSLTCSGVPWMVDPRLDTGNIKKSTSFFTNASSTVPPRGWLSAEEAKIVDWKSSIISGTSTPAFVVRSTTSKIYLLGGSLSSNYDTMPGSVVAIPYIANQKQQQVELSGAQILANSVMPVGRSKLAAVFYRSLAGDHVLAIGGVTGSSDTVGSTTVQFGTFIGDSDISWETDDAYQLSTTEGPYPIYNAQAHYHDGTVHVLGGFTNNLPSSSSLKIDIDPITGRPTGSWTICGNTNNDTSIVGSFAYVADGDLNFIIQSGSGLFYIKQKNDGTFTNPVSVVDVNGDNATALTGHHYFPMTYAGQHIFAVSNDGGSVATYAAKFVYDHNRAVLGTTPFILSSSWDVVGPAIMTSTGAAISGSTFSLGSIIFAGGAETSNTADITLAASNAVISFQDDDEFATRGMQLGPAAIRPVYPLLDDVYSLKFYDDPLTNLAPNHGDIRGLRPGLRGTESSGTWNVLIGMSTKQFDPDLGHVVDSGSGVWFRQARIELISDTGIDIGECYPSRSRRWLKSSLVPSIDGYQGISLVSGAGAWDVGLNQTELYQFPDYGRSVGITSQTASSPASFAVQAFITGSLYTYLVDTSGSASFPWFLNGNGFGTPYIPDSLMALSVTGTAEDIDASASQEMYHRTIGRQTLIPNANTITDYLRRINYSQTTQQIAESSSIPPSASYFGF